MTRCHFSRPFFGWSVGQNTRMYFVNPVIPTNTKATSILKSIESDPIEPLKPIESKPIDINDFGDELDQYETGEIVVVNGGISPGYWNDEKKSNEVFSTEEDGERLYFTGDLGQRLPNVKIKFMGRKDNQVKIRGYRINTGEIVNQLIRDDNIINAAVIIKETEDHEKELIAFVVGTMCFAVSSKERILSERLPINSTSM